MFKKIGYLLFAGSSLLVQTANAQYCGTDELYHKLKAEHPAEVAANEAILEQRVKADQLYKLAKTTDDTTLYHIPVVVHVIHDYGAEYVTDDAIYTAVKNWNISFQKKNADTSDVIAPFKKYIGNARIQLDLATIDPNGNPTKGITRTQTYLANNATDQAKMSYWNQSKYLNIWVVGAFGSNLTGVAAYSQYPGSITNNLWYDGVISISNYMDYDNTIVHEIGHFLNLQHPWGNNNSQAVACGDDQVDDTPPTKGHNQVGCVASALYDVACAAGYTKTYTVNGVTTVIDYPDTVNAQNIMDYTYCSKMFTLLQVDRMHSALTAGVASRSNLITAANQTATGASSARPDLPPVAAFSIDRGYANGLFPTTFRQYFSVVGSNNSFTFKNQSWGDTIMSVLWTFSNGAATPTSTNATGTVQNTFSQPGWVSVSLAATGNNSGTTTYTNPNAVYVADSAMLHAGGYVQNFSSDNEMGKWPSFNYYNNNFKWERYTGAGYDDNSSVRYRSFDYRTAPENKSGTPAGDYDDIFTPGFTLTELAGNSMNLNFYTAGSRINGNGNDSLEIAASTNLGRTWTTFSYIVGTDLMNNTSSSEFVPASTSQWKARTVSIPDAYKTDKVFFRFRYKPSVGGNDLYLDKFSLTQFTTEVNELVKNAAAVKLYPNPTNGDTKLYFTTGNDGNIAYTVRDITGKVIIAKSVKHAANSVGEEELSASLFPTSGMYLITIKMADKIVTEKLMVNK